MVSIRSTIHISTAGLCGLGTVCIGCLQIVEPASALSVLTGCLAPHKHHFFRTTLTPTPVVYHYFLEKIIHVSQGGESSQEPRPFSGQWLDSGLYSVRTRASLPQRGVRSNSWWLWPALLLPLSCHPCFGGCQSNHKNITLHAPGTKCQCALLLF